MILVFDVVEGFLGVTENRMMRTLSFRVFDAKRVYGLWSKGPGGCEAEPDK